MGEAKTVRENSVGESGFCIGEYRSASSPFWMSGRCDIYSGVGPKNRRVLIKRLNDKAAVQRPMVDALKAESEALKAVAKIPVAAVPDYVDFVEEGADVALIEEFVDGKPLTIPKRGEKFARWRPYEVRRFLDQMLVTLREVHRLGYVHNDIKPVNILCRPNDPLRPYTLVDFGNAQHRGIAAHYRGARDVNAVVGSRATVEYSAPERSEGGPGYHCSDLYSLGILAIQLLTGADLRELNWNAQGHIGLPLYQYAKDPVLDRVLVSMTCHFPWQRYQDVDEVVRALDKQETGEILEKPVEPKRQGRNVVAIVVLAILLALSYVAWKSAMSQYCHLSVGCSQSR